MTEGLKAWGVVSTHGKGAKALANGLSKGVSEPREICQRDWPVSPNGRSTGFYVNDRSGISVLQVLVDRLESAWVEALEQITTTEEIKIRENCSLIFASTKGCIEDFIWNDKQGEPYSPIVEAFLDRAKIKPKRWLTISNACASSHSALHLARSWIRRGVSKNVIVIAADYLGPFVLQGFHTLRALSPTTIRPFDKRRDGLLLGEAAAVAILSADESDILISGTGVDCEGYAATRPEGSAVSLQRAILTALGHRQPDAVIAHGTATQANDSAEDQAFSAVLSERPWVTGTKWSVGHCLGASGLVDLVVAAEWLKHNTPMALANCQAPDPNLRLRLLTASSLSELQPQKWKSLLVTSLGFGGVHSALFVECR